MNDDENLEEKSLEYFLKMPKPPGDKMYPCHTVNEARRLGWMDGFKDCRNTEPVELDYRLKMSFELIRDNLDCSCEEDEDEIHMYRCVRCKCMQTIKSSNPAAAPKKEEE